MGSALPSHPHLLQEGEREGRTDQGPYASRGSEGGSVGNQVEQGQKRAKSMFTWDLWDRAGWPACWCRMEGPPLPRPGSEVLSTHCLPQLISELPIPWWGLNVPLEEGLVQHSNAFPGAFSKGAEGAWGRRCLKVKEAADTFFPIVNSIFILHPHHPQALYLGFPGWRGWGFRSSPEEGMYLKEIKFNNKFL